MRRIATSHLRSALTCGLALASALLAGVIGACSADLHEGTYTCTPDSASNCPPGWLCECRGAKCDWRCYASAGGSCGDEVLGPGEECDGEAISTQHRCATGFTYCLADCTVACTQCGDGEAETTPTGTELCDDGNLLSHDGCSSTCLPEDPAWRELAPRTSSPPPRTEFAMAYDAARGRLVMFGGVNRARDPAIYYSDTWEWDGRGWLQVSVGSGPSARSGHAMAYDAARRKVVLLGGAARSTGDPAIWEWDGARWRRIAAVSPGPAGIVGHQLAYDARRDRVVFFGSSTSSESETWEWDGGQRTWAKIAPTGAAPPPRGFAGMTYDPVRGKVVLYGGTGASQPLGDLWEWDGAARTWSAVEPANTPPAPGQVEAMFYDLAQKKIVVVSSVSEIWTWDGGARSWSRSTVVAPLPEPRTRFAMAYVPPGRAAVLFGGMALTDTWLWSGTAWTEARSAFPVPSANGALVYDPTQARVLAVKYGATIETWEWKDQVWTQLVSTGATPATLVPRNVAFDPRRQRLFGFRGSPTEAWEWNGSQWAMVATPPVFASPYSSVVYDPTDRRIQVFVGNATIDQAKWNGTQWQLGALLGARRLGAALAVDPARNRTVLFSGFDGSLTREETWELSGTSWSRRNPGQSPRPTDSAMMTYHPGRRRSILVADSRTWEWDGDDWSDITPVTPGPSFVSNLAYDASQQSVVADSSGGKVWSLRYESAQTPDENCHAGVDVDRDGLIGCADPDCWAYCSPFCPPGQPCDAADRRCGDGTCSAALETCQACPQDCGACPSVCGDYACTAGESAASCAGDCP